MDNDKEITIWDIAKKLNISIATVSRALKDDPVVQKKTKKKILETALQMGYRSNNFARNLRSKNSNTIGIIVPQLSSFFHSCVISGVEKVANAEGYNLIISQSSESYEHEKQSALTMFNSRVDGLLVSLSYETESIEHFEPFFKKNIPLIFFDRITENKNAISIVIDNRKAGYEITEHLISQGCNRIMHVTASLKRNVYQDRLQGYKQALADHHIPFQENMVKLTTLSMESGELVAQDILKMKKLPDAIFFSNDNCAVGCMTALKKAGINIPQTIAVAGFNNDPLCRVVEPNLTSMQYSGLNMGKLSATNLINHIKGENILSITNTIILRSELIIRDSSLRLPNKTTLSH
jgi:LacI family transcriptional regulator